MTFLLDHCIWRETENILSKGGFNCVTLRGLGKTEASNGELIALSKKRKSILITRDRDFANLTLYPLGSHQGIILLRISPQTINEAHNVLLSALRAIPTEQLHGNLLIITSTTYRLHKAK